MMPHHVQRQLERILGQEGFDGLDPGSLSQATFGDLPAWLQRLVRASDELPLHDVPPAVTQVLYATFDHGHRPTRDVAVLVSDSRHDRVPVGTRGGGPEEWTLSYSSPAADVVLDLTQRPDGQLDLLGYVMALREPTTACRVAIHGPVEASVDTDRLGRFTVSPLRPARYTLDVDHATSFSLALNVDLTESA